MVIPLPNRNSVRSWSTSLFSIKTFFISTGIFPSLQVYVPKIILSYCSKFINFLLLYKFSEPISNWLENVSSNQSTKDSVFPDLLVYKIKTFFFFLKVIEISYFRVVYRTFFKEVCPSIVNCFWAKSHYPSHRVLLCWKDFC